MVQMWNLKKIEDSFTGKVGEWGKGSQKGSPDKQRLMNPSDTLNGVGESKYEMKIRECENRAIQGGGITIYN